MEHSSRRTSVQSGLKAHVPSAGSQCLPASSVFCSTPAGVSLSSQQKTSQEKGELPIAAVSSGGLWRKPQALLALCVSPCAAADSPPCTSPARSSTSCQSCGCTAARAEFRNGTSALGCDRPARVARRAGCSVGVSEGSEEVLCSKSGLVAPRLCLPSSSASRLRRLGTAGAASSSRVNTGVKSTPAAAAFMSLQSVMRNS